MIEADILVRSIIGDRARTMIRHPINHLSFLLTAAAAGAFQLPSSIPARHSSTLFDDGSIKIRFHDRLPNPATSATALHGRLWKSLQIEEDDPADGTSWYLINCIAGIELDLLNQARYVCADFPASDVEKFVVPTERHLRSHGDKKKVVDVKVRYPGYVFCKIRMIEEVYETLQSLELARSWMGTVNRRGHKKLPPAPLPLNDEEVKRFKGLEEAQEMFEDMYGGDYTGRADAGADLLEQYAGYDVGQMVKVLKGNFDGEDGTVRRLKGGQLMVRMFTYGQTYDEWFDPDAIRPLSDLEVMRGMSGPTVPVDQDQFDVSIGKKDPSELLGEDSPSLRSGLMQDAGAGPGRNRREDRVARGETGRDMFGRDAEDVKREEQNWLAFREEKRAGQRGDDSNDPDIITPVLTEAKKEKAKGPLKGRDTWGIVERSSWSGGEYGFEANSEREEKDLFRRTTDIYRDRPQRGGRGRGGGRDSFDGRGRGSFRGGDFDDRRGDRDARERRPVRESRDRGDDRSSSSGDRDDDVAGKEDDFFDSLMSELSDDLNNEDGSSSEGGGPSRGARGSRSHDFAGPSANARATEKSSSGQAEDSFFENLMSELGGALDEPSSSAPSGQNVKSDRRLDDDDFFSNLEAELSQSLGGDFGGDKGKSGGGGASVGDDDDDFFASLQQEMGKALDESPEKVDGGALQDDFFSSLIDDVADELESSGGGEKVEETLEASHDDFFSSLINDVADELESETVEEVAGGKRAMSGSHGDLSSLKVLELKEMLRSRGLKVGGKKAELIERLQGQS